MKPSRGNWILILVPLLFAILAIAAGQGIATTMMPGDIIDARLNNYFLEHVYQFLNGNTHSLWHLPFFAPYPYILGLSDNLFGSAPIYLLARFLSLPSETAFQAWFLVGYIVNYAAAYYALRKLGASHLSSVVGSLIFAFALPTAAHAPHAQLHYRFGIPLGLTYYVLFLNQKNFHHLATAAIWTVWQFYCGIYMGFFTLLFLAAITVSHIGLNHLLRSVSATGSITELTHAFRAYSKTSKLNFALVFAALIAAMAMLFYPYLQVTKIYEVQRHWGDISPMLPRPQSYFLTYISQLWSPPNIPIYTNLPMRHEHQMFPGFIPFILMVSGFLIGSFKKNGPSYILLSGSAITVILITLYAAGFSLWILIYKLPLASKSQPLTKADNRAAVAGPPSPLNPAVVPAIVVIIPAVLILRTRALSASQKYKFPLASNAIPQALSILAAVAGPPSPLNPGTPVPAKVVTIPDGFTLRMAPPFQSVKYILPVASFVMPVVVFIPIAVAAKPSPG